MTPTSTATPLPPTLILARGTVGVLQQDSVTGSHFGSREIVSFFVDPPSTAIFSTTTTTSGTLSTTLTIPQMISGTHVLLGVGQHSGLSAQTSFTIVPAISLALAAGPASTINVLQGGGFAPGEHVTATWVATSTNPIVLGQTTTNSVGGFSAGSAITFTVPISPGGVYHITATGQTSGGSPSVVFTLLPRVSVTPTSGHAGTMTTLAGKGYGARESVHIFFNCSSSTCQALSLGTAATTSQGTFSGVSLTIPLTATLGATPIGVLGGNTQEFTSTVFTVN